MKFRKPPVPARLPAYSLFSGVRYTPSGVFALTVITPKRGRMERVLRKF
jgi:hypothetical protein